MAFSEIEITKYKQIMDAYLVKARPNEEIRKQVDVCYRIGNQSVEIFEIRNINNKIIESPIAKAKYVRTEDRWQILWQRADMKWHLYEPKIGVKTLNEFIKVIEKDEFGCFWG
ncbi:MAG: hypothetical protein AMQ22_01565 [Candidatus Methanofastidiosum methylothiophilum]|uniref:DUF3024 domain-containing protein n=1 Tax=Candidatus Methanofastidiosum methylothiophilum TaxID=1705564 RepID=A0A150IXY2_9EURY|nr:MAG: hypothetical protein AMQ22_01565 [Candidatus Methanofastidiosum methylthiophilus]